MLPFGDWDVEAPKLMGVKKKGKKEKKEALFMDEQGFFLWH